MALFDFSALPGLGTARETAEKAFLWGKHEQAVFRSVVVNGSSTDVNNGTTTELRVGLLMAQVSNKWVPYNPLGTDGSEKVAGVLANSVRTLNLDGTTGDRVTVVVVSGPVKGGQLIRNVSGSAAVDPLARALMGNSFVFDDQLTGNSNPWSRVVPKTADYSVALADSGTEFTNTGATGAVVFTLPALLDAGSKVVTKGVVYRFTVTAAQTIAAKSTGSDGVIWFNDAAHTTFTTSNKVGITLEARVNDDGTKWILTTLGAATSEITAS